MIMKGHLTSERAVVVSVGAVTAQGATADDLWEGLCAGSVAIRPVENLSMEGYRTSIAGEVQCDFSDDLDVGYPDGYEDRALDFLLAAATEAMTGGAAVLEQVPSERWGVVLSSCNAGLISAEQWYEGRKQGRRADPRLLMFSTPQGLAEAIAGVWGFQGPVHSINTACAAGANAVGHAASLIRSGQADAVLTGGTDALSDVLISGFNSLESLSPEPAAPYARTRQGLSLGEGSGMLVLVSDEVADRLALPVMAEVVALGLSADGYHPTAPHPGGQGAGRAIREGLRTAGLAPEDVGYINSHGTGTQKNDTAETMAIKFGLGAAASQTAISSTKSMIGHLLGAAGAVEAIVTVKTLQHQTAPPTANLDEAAADCDLDYVPNRARPLDVDVALSNNFAFGGANASLVLARERSAERPTPQVDRVMITGVGALTPAGPEESDLWQAYVDGRDCSREEDGAAIGRLELGDSVKRLSPKARRRMDRLALVSVVSGILALEDGGLTVDDDNRDRIGAVLGTGIGPMDAMETFSRPVLDEGAPAANPAVFPNTVYNAATGQVAINLGTVGPTTTITSGHAAGAAAIAYSADLLASDQADAMLAIGADTLTDTVIDGYRDLGTLGRNGFRLAESGVTLLMERDSAVQARGGRPIAELLGYADASDGLGAGRWDDDGRGIERAIHLALERAGLGAADLCGIWSGLTGHRRADHGERRALDRVFGTRTPIHAHRMLLGEPIGAGASVASALAIASWRHGAAAGPMLINSSSFGGSHTCLILAPAAGADSEAGR